MLAYISQMELDLRFGEIQYRVHVQRGVLSQTVVIVIKIKINLIIIQLTVTNYPLTTSKHMVANYY